MVAYGTQKSPIEPMFMIRLGLFVWVSFGRRVLVNWVGKRAFALMIASTSSNVVSSNGATLIAVPTLLIRTVR